MKKPRMSEDEARSIVMAYTPMNDKFFEKIVEDPKVLEEMLQIFLENPLLRIKPDTVVGQKSIRNLQGRSIRMDAYAEGHEDLVFNVEIQRADNCNHQKRVRYISSVITANRSEPGDDFEDIQELYVIYVSEEDILGTGKTFVHQEVRLKETGQIINDGLHVMYVNAEIISDSKIARYMEQFKKPFIDSDEFENLKNRVNGIKSDKTEVQKMSKEVIEYAEKYAKEFAEEYAKEYVKESIKNLAENGVPLEKVSKSFPKIPIDEVQEIFNSITKKES